MPCFFCCCSCCFAVMVVGLCWLVGRFTHLCMLYLCLFKLCSICFLMRHGIRVNKSRDDDNLFYLNEAFFVCASFVCVSKCVCAVNFVCIWRGFTSHLISVFLYLVNILLYIQQHRCKVCVSIWSQHTYKKSPSKISVSNIHDIKI